MNCANHPDRPRAAFCQNCGKPLCTECVRNVGTSVYCEQCLAARVAGTAPSAGYAYTSPGAGTYPPAGPPIVPGEPSPGLAALLGFIPGVGAMYNGQYAKGIVHLIVFAVLTSLADNSSGDIFGIFVAGWIAYMVIEAHHTARARRDGTPLPNPFGLNDIGERLGFGRAWPNAGPYNAAPGAAPTGQSSDPANPNAPPPNPYAPPYSYNYVPPVSHWGAPYNAPPNPPAPGAQPAYPDPNLPYYRRFPSGAIWLIALGFLFLVGNIRAFHIFRGGLSGAVFMIGFGVWLFVRRMTNTGQGLENDGTPLYHWRLSRAISGSFWIVLLGVILLLRDLGILSMAHSWPLFMIGAGVLMFIRRAVDYGYSYPPYPPYPPQPPQSQPAAAPVTTTAIVAADPIAQARNENSGDNNFNDEREGR